MTEFANRHIATSKAEWLVKAILEIIETDEGIPDTDLFYLQPDGQPISKAGVCAVTEFVLPALLVGAMHYILIHRQDKNELGVATLNAIGTKAPRRERVYTGKLGNKIQRLVTVERTCDVQNKHNAAKDTVFSAAEQPEIQKRDAHSVIEEKLYASARAMATVWQSAINQLADDMTEKAPKSPVYKRLNEEILSEKDCALLEKFRDHVEEILRYCIENDPSAGATRITLADEIHAVCRVWNFELRKIKDAAFRQLVIDTTKTLNEYSYYLSDKFLRLIPGTETLWFRNESREEGEQLRNVLQPESYRLRCEIARLYERLYPIPEDDEIRQTDAEVVDATASGAADKSGSIVHQTIVNQYGDHPVHIGHVENLKL